MKRIEIFASDVDGVMTDGAMYYLDSGDSMKRFNVKDGMGFVMLKGSGVKTAIITAETSKIVERRAAKIKADLLFQGVSDKLSCAKDMLAKLGLSMDKLSYIGDDINDIPLLEAAALKACPADAADAVKAVDGIIVLSQNGGYGAVREFAQIVLDLNSREQQPA